MNLLFYVSLHVPFVSLDTVSCIVSTFLILDLVALLESKNVSQILKNLRGYGISILPFLIGTVMLFVDEVFSTIKPGETSVKNTNE